MQTQSLSQRTSRESNGRKRAERRRAWIKVDAPFNSRFIRERDPNVNPLSQPIARRSAFDILVDSFVWQLRYVPANAHPLVSQEDLPSELLKRARNLAARSTWRAWTDDVRVWFIVARLRNPQDASIGVLDLEVSFFDSDGRRVAAGEWALQPDGRWTLYRMMNVPLAPSPSATAIHRNPTQGSRQ